MTSCELAEDRIDAEIERIVGLLRDGLGTQERAVLGLSGGIDSDVTARLAVRAVGAARLKFFTVVQADMEDRHLDQARQLAAELAVPLVELPLAGWAWGLIDILAHADTVEGFRQDAFLDIGRAKNSLRGVVYSTYHDRGYITLGSSNRTEIECGFFVRFGDGIWHLGPLAHLYKTQVYQLAAALGSRHEVSAQPASAGYWQGQSDLEDIAYWLVNQAPIGAQRSFSAEEIALAGRIHSELSFPRLDRALAALACGQEAAAVATASGLSLPTAERLRQLVAAAARIKGRPLGARLSPPAGENLTTAPTTITGRP